VQPKPVVAGQSQPPQHEAMEGRHSPFAIGESPETSSNDLTQDSGEKRTGNREQGKVQNAALATAEGQRAQ
jgi:hypothetical protein